MSPFSGGLRLEHWVTKIKITMKNVHRSNINAEFAVLSWRCSNFGRLDLRLRKNIMMLMLMVVGMLMSLVIGVVMVI